MVNKKWTTLNRKIALRCQQNGTVVKVVSGARAGESGKVRSFIPGRRRSDADVHIEPLDGGRGFWTEIGDLRVEW